MIVPRLLAITSGQSLGDLVALGRAGLPGVLIREPALSAEALEAAVDAAIRAVPFVAVHDRNPHARRIAADRGVTLHVTAGTPPPAGIRFAASTHDGDEVERALSAGAVYTTLSPVWSPLSKPDDRRPPLGLDVYLAIAGDRPVLALGGVTVARYHTLVGRGAPGAAVLAGLAGPVEMSRRALRRFLRRE